MQEIFRQLTPRARVLDLGSRFGSFDASAHPGRTYRVDIEMAGEGVEADAARLPFRDRAFDAVISNHSLEHFTDLTGVLNEIKRVLTPEGALFVAVPDATTFTDVVYRFFASGGGHVNAFRSAEVVISIVVERTGLEFRGMRTLYTSLSFLHPEHRKGSWAIRMLPLALTGEWTLRWALRLFRWTDRRFGTRLGVYGWAFYFGNVREQLETTPWKNVCVRCGSAHPTASLVVRRGCFRCPDCGTTNFFTRDA